MAFRELAYLFITMISLTQVSAQTPTPSPFFIMAPDVAPIAAPVFAPASAPGILPPPVETPMVAPPLAPVDALEFAPVLTPEAPASAPGPAPAESAGVMVTVAGWRTIILAAGLLATVFFQ